MSIKIMTAVWENSTHKQTNLLILLALADFANDDGWCWPSLTTLARKARTSKRNAQTIIRTLEANGEIKILEGQGVHGTHLYQVLVRDEETSPLGVDDDAIPTGGGEAQREMGVKPTSSEPSLKDNHQFNHQKDSRSNDRGRKNSIRKALEEEFVDISKLRSPKLNTAKQRKAAARAWWIPLNEIAELTDWDERRGCSLIRLTVIRMRKDKLTIAEPRSILKVAKSIVAEGTGRSMSGAKEFLDDLRGD